MRVHNYDKTKNINDVSSLELCLTEHQHTCHTKKERFLPLTFPSYSRRESTSGAIYAGVPTADFGLECSTDDCYKLTISFC